VQSVKNVSNHVEGPVMKKAPKFAFNLPPDDLIKGYFHGNVLGLSSWDLLVKPVVEIVARRTVVKETKGRQRDESLHVESSSGDENLQKSNTENCQYTWMAHRRVKGTSIEPLTFSMHLLEPRSHQGPSQQAKSWPWWSKGSCQENHCMRPSREQLHREP
jgi:hypothetical protein